MRLVVVWGRQITVDLGETSNNTTAKGSCEQCTHLTTVPANARLKPIVEETDFHSQYVNISQ